MRISLRYFCILILVISILIFILGNDYGHYLLRGSSSSSTSSSILQEDAIIENHCPWQENDPVLYNMKTKLGVSYEGGHWFHMAENFMVQHSILRREGKLTNASLVYYNFDKDDFINELNGVTKMIVSLGTIGLGSLNERTANYINLKTKDQDIISNMQYGQSFTMTRLRIKDHLFEDLSPSVDVEKRFVMKLDKSNLKPDRSVVCVKNMGSIGGQWPTPQRGHWFPNPGDIEAFRNKIRLLCPVQVPKKTVDDKYKLVIYQRDLSRKLANEIEAISIIKERLGDKWDIQVLMHSKDRSPCALSMLLNDVDVLVTPHGFQSMLLLFLPRPAIIFEIFPFRYYKRGYGPFSNEYGVIHGGVMSPATSIVNKVLLSLVPSDKCILSKQCRGYARNSDVILTAHGVNKLSYLIETNVHVLTKQCQQGSRRDFLFSNC